MKTHPKIEVRNLRFDIGDNIPRYWHGGRRSVTHFFNAMSIVFPVGERFFIRSVKANLPFVKDAQLRKDIKAFMGQEGAHTREHEAYNRMLSDQGYPIRRLEEETLFLLRLAKRVFNDRGQLGVTMGLEHLTAVLGNWFLLRGSFEGAHPVMAALWRWHAAEETEHKSVAYDVYGNTDGNYLERTFLLWLVTVFFIGKILQHQAVLMKQDGILFSVPEWLALGQFLFVKPGGMFTAMAEWLAYMKPGFHPWDLDNRDVLQSWSQDYASQPVYKRA